MTKPTMELVEELCDACHYRAIGIVAHGRDALLSEIRQRLEAMERDAARYRWLRDMKCNSYSISFNDGPSTNYMTVREWMEECMPEAYADVPADVADRMKQSNTLWSIQIYPNTPIGFNDYHGDTLDAAIDAAMAEGEAHVPE